MKFIKSIHKYFIILIYFLLISLIVYITYIVNSKEPINKKFRRDIKLIIKNNSINKNLLNDYREEFLPNTQFMKLNFKKIELDFLKLNDCYFGKCYTFFLEKFRNNLILLERNGKLKFIKFHDLDKKNINFIDIESNLNFDYVLDVLIDGDKIYISGKKENSDNETVLEIVKAKFNTSNIKFENIISLRSEKCILRHAVHSGKMQIINDNEKKILLAINSAGNVDQPDNINLTKDSICGKTLLINPQTGKYDIFTSGHRNMIGLYADDKVIIGTEHGPFGGDEINKLEKDKIYGWPKASYGEKYSRNQSDDKNYYAKNHKSFGFEEPIFSFLPAIGISEIIRLPNSFSDIWQDNFLLASLNAKYLYRIKFDQNFKKIIYYEPIFIGDRIRDLMYHNDEILLSLELEGSLGILSK